MKLSAQGRMTISVAARIVGMAVVLALYAGVASAQIGTCPASPTPPNGATAQCNDNTWSMSQNRSGTCSTHSGAKCYVCPGPLCGMATCSYSVSPISASFPASGGTGTVSVAATGGCGWLAASSAGFITITAGSSGTGTGTVTYSVSPNASAARSGALTIAGQTVTVSQLAATTSGPIITTNPTSQTVGVGQSTSFSVAASGSPTFVWQVSSNGGAAWGNVTSTPPYSGATTSTLTVTGVSVGLSGYQYRAVATNAGGSAISNSATLTVNSPVGSAAPFGSFDTPLNGANVAGSIAVTGWALDDVGVNRVELWRDVVAGETTPPYAGPGPGTGKVFIANAFFIAGARPDVAAAYPTFPQANRAGWGYLLLTQGLWSQGNGLFTFYAFAYDDNGHVTTLGAKTITSDNAHAVRPFGGIDSPTYGQTVTTSFWNFGWALTPKPNSADPRSCVIVNGSVQVGIDSGPLVNVNYGDDRPDIAAGFPGFSNGAGAGGAYFIDTTTLTNGTHQIGWLVTDNCGRADGIGARFFTVFNGGGTSTATVGTAVAATAPSALTGEPVDVRRGDDLTLVYPNASGDRVVAIDQGERVSVQLPPVGGGTYAGYQVVNGGRKALPLGSSLDAQGGIFYWQPAAGFLGSFDLAFISTDSQTVLVRVVVGPSVRMAIDTPQEATAVSVPFLVGGWVLDLAAPDGTGIDAVHVWAYPEAGGNPTFLGVATIGDSRPDVAMTYGDRFLGSAFNLAVDRLPAGIYDIVVYPHSAVSGDFSAAQTVRVTVH